MGTLRQRILWILENRRMTQRELALAAGLSENFLTSRLSKMKADPTATVDTDTLVALARAGRVSVSWLADEQGGPDDAQRRMRELPSWERELAVARVKSAGIPDEYWKAAGDASVPIADVTWEIIAGVARELYAHAMRTQPVEDEPADIASRPRTRAAGPEVLPRRRKRS